MKKVVSLEMIATLYKMDNMLRQIWKLATEFQN